MTRQYTSQQRAFMVVAYLKRSIQRAQQSFKCVFQTAECHIVPVFGQFRIKATRLGLQLHDINNNCCFDINMFLFHSFQCVHHTYYRINNIIRLLHPLRKISWFDVFWRYQFGNHDLTFEIPYLFSDNIFWNRHIIIKTKLCW